MSKLNARIYQHIDAWRHRPIKGDYPYVYVDGILLKRAWAGEVRHVAVLVAIGVDTKDYRHVLGVAEGHKEDKAGWSGFLKHLKERGLSGVRLVVSDACMGLLEALADICPEARWQRCIVHFYRNVFSHVPKAKVREVAILLKAIHAQEDTAAARAKAEQVIEKLRAMRLRRAAQMVEEGIDDTLTYYGYPDSRWRRLRTNNPMERLNREIRRRTRVVGAFPDGQSAVILAAARLRHIAGTKWGTRCYLDMRKLREMDLQTAAA